MRRFVTLVCLGVGVLFAACEPEGAGIPAADQAESSAASLDRIAPQGEQPSADDSASAVDPLALRQAAPGESAGAPPEGDCPEGAQPLKTKDGLMLPCGFQALVNVDVWHQCTVNGQQQPATGFRFTLTQFGTGVNPTSIPVMSTFANVWSTLGNPVIDEVSASKLVEWRQGANSTAVAYGGAGHFGYSLVGDPDHWVTAQWLFPLASPPVPVAGCIAAAVSTDWNDAEIIPVAFHPRAAAPRPSQFVALAQRSHVQPLRLNLYHTSVKPPLALSELVAGSPRLVGMQPLMTDVIMPISTTLDVKLPVREGDAYTVLVAEWWETGGPRRPTHPLMVVYQAVAAQPDEPTPDAGSSTG